MKAQLILRQQRAQADGVHVLLVLFVMVLVVALGFTCYMLFKGKNTTNEQYQADSRPQVMNPNNHPICGIIFDINKGYKDAVIANSEVHH